MDQINSPALSPAAVVPDFGFTVFLVEDDEAARHSLRESLAALGFRVRSFKSCEDFWAERQTLGVGCLLLDYHFEGMSGLDLLYRLAREGVVLPTILYSGRFGGFLRRRAAGIANVIKVLDKPLDGRDLLEALHAAQLSPQRPHDLAVR